MNNDNQASLEALIKFLRTCPGVKVEVAAGDFQPYIHFHFLLRSLDALEAMRAQRSLSVLSEYDFKRAGYEELERLDAEIARILRGEKA